MSFFTKQTIKKPNCPKCGLSKGCLSPKMRYSGEGAKDILIIAEAPSKEEDKQGKPLVGTAGHRLSVELKKLGIDLHKDCYKTNSVNCRPVNREGKDAEPTNVQIECCKPYVLGIIREVQPKKIFIMGNSALESFYGGRTEHMSSVGKTHGLQFWDSTHNAWVFPLWHPSYVENNLKDGLLQAEWKRCLKRAIEADSTPLTKQWNKLTLLHDFTQAKEALTHCLKNETLIAIDFETTGLDMYKEGHKTVSFGWANNEGAWATPVEHPCFTSNQQSEIKALVSKILGKRKIKKIVHNITFEYQWTKAQLNTEPRNFFYDTQLAAHVLDNRTGTKKLKFQTFMRWGIGEYDAGIKDKIKADPSTGFNRMLQVPVDQLLEYNAKDCLYTYELYREQLDEFRGREFEAYKFIHDGALALSEMSYNGISISEEHYLQAKAELQSKRDELAAEIYDSKEVRLYKKQSGDFNFDSPKDLQKMLFEVLKLESIKKTKTGDSVDEEVLTKINHPLTNKVLEIRKLNKMISTYIDGFLDKSYDGMLHPTFSLTRARSLRSSSSEPNFQNIPKRDLTAKKTTRTGMVPRTGRALGEMDFSGAEIVTSIYYHKDPTFIKYQTEGGADMHTDASAEIFKCKPEDIPKPIRQTTKSVWTFAQFYGSYFKNCAAKGWDEYPKCVEKDGTPCKISGIDVGKYIIQTFGNYKNFENHLKRFENKFWHEWFSEYTRWKKKVVSDHKKNGYIETLFGFRYKGYMSEKQCCNYPIQGTSFHLLLYAIIQFCKELKKRKLNTLMIGQIHDSLVLDIPENEISEVADILTDIVRNMHNQLDWMMLPMDLEFEVSDTYENGGSFAKMVNFQLKKAA
jgi:DNA polymerase-1